jgi:predicted peptidase
VLRLEKAFQDNKAKTENSCCKFFLIGSVKCAIDSSKIMIKGGSYGGYMSWAVEREYNDENCQRWGI